MIEASTSFPASLITIAGGYGCSGQAVQARRLIAGLYEVKFDGSPVGIAIATSEAAGGIYSYPEANTVSVRRLGPGDFMVSVYNPATNALLDDAFAVVTPVDRLGLACVAWLNQCRASRC